MNAVFQTLLPRLESDQLDFKKTGYRLDDEDGRTSLVKDIVCMANTPRDDDSYIITGVKKSTDGSYVLCGVDSHPDDADLQSLFVDRIYPAPAFRYEVISQGEKQFGLFVIPPVRVGPCVAVKDLGSLRQWQIYFRRQSRNTPATPKDAIDINAWFSTNSVPPRAAYEEPVPGWNHLCELTKSFDPSFRFVLVLSPSLHTEDETLVGLALVPWSFVLDFDPHSDVDGVLAAVKPTLRERRGVHVTTLKDSSVNNVSLSTEWCLPRGIYGRPETLALGKWLDWKKAFGTGLSAHIRQVAALSAPNPVVIIVIWNDPSLIRYLQSALESCIESFGETANIVLLSNNEHEYESLVSETGATALRIPLDQFCRGLEHLYDGHDISSDDCVIPSSSGAPITISATERRWLEEELEFVSLGVGLIPNGEAIAGHRFLRGDEPSWYDLGLHYDIDRDVADSITLSIRRDLEARRANRTNLYHAPGAGGTTLGKRMLWNFRKQYPCVMLKTSVPRNTVERLLRLAAISGLPVLVMSTLR